MNICFKCQRFKKTGCGYTHKKIRNKCPMFKEKDEKHYR